MSDFYVAEIRVVCPCGTESGFDPAYPAVRSCPYCDKEYRDVGFVEIEEVKDGEG